ncbi:serine hydrolase [bacterium]|nr:serine hydrolase [bacterium]
MLKRSIGLFGALLLGFSSLSQPWKNDPDTRRWADSVLTTLDDSARIAQLFVISAYSNRGEDHRAELVDWVERRGVGGLIFFQGGPGRQTHLTQALQGRAKVPLLISIDGEWGPAMRLDSALRFPWALTLGSIDDSALHYDHGRRIGAQCKSLGIHWNFAPVLDVNTNPDNPIINARSYGQDPEKVRRAAVAFSLGMQSQGVLACGKHFPGHGDTRDDSHKTLPKLEHSAKRLEAVELVPFRAAVASGMASIMVGHLSVPALDTSGRSASLSEIMVQKMLRDQWGYEGLIVTDALNMQGADGYTQPGDLERAAFLAGSDVLLCPRDPEAGMHALHQALDSGWVDSTRLAQSVHRILMAKHWSRTQMAKSGTTEGQKEALSAPSDRRWIESSAQRSVVVLRNRGKRMPLRTPYGRIAIVLVGKDIGSEFVTSIRLRRAASVFLLDPAQVEGLADTLDHFDHLIIAAYTAGSNPWKSYKIKPEEADIVRVLSRKKGATLVFFGNPYGLKYSGGLEEADGVVLAHQNHPAFERAAAQVLFDGISSGGHLPVDVSKHLKQGEGENTASGGVLGFGSAESVGMDSTRLSAIDGMVKASIDRGDIPGAQVLVARRGKVVYHKAFGTLHKGGEDTVSVDNLYDLASITKIAASTLGLMYAVEQGKIRLDDSLGALLPELSGTDKSRLVLRDILAHQAGLPAWIPLWPLTFEHGSPNPELYRKRCEEGFERQVCDSLFLHTEFAERQFQEVVRAPLSPGQGYKYSDLGYYFIQRILEREMGVPLDVLVENRFYRPMGLERMLYRPLEHYSREQIAPTEFDLLFRKRLVHGYVHDPGAALMGGVAGHAGLFSNALDLARLMQMLIQSGTYGGQRYLQPETIAEFTRCAFCSQGNRRGLGFDKPQLSGSGPTCGCTSPNSFGHTGFTGTMVWADPEHQLVYVFLSNRVHPDAANNGLLRSNLRTEIQTVIYDAIQTENP